MEALLLTYRAEPLREFPLIDQPLEVGSGPGADVVVHDPDVAERHYLVRRDGLDVWVHDLRAGAGDRPTRLAPGAPLPLGRHHALVRAPDVPTRRGPLSGRTEPLPIVAAPEGPLSLVVGTGTDARRVPIGTRPFVVGTAPDAELLLSDRAVSARHCRIEPGHRGPRIRDLGSRNGTFVDGVRTSLAALRPGSHVRVGRTELSVVLRGPLAPSPGGLVVASAAMRDVMERARRVGSLSWPVLVLGETGVGKEGVAQTIHAASPRASGPFVAVNAGAMPRDLVESELFGHERGAFTGAGAQRRGVFEQADGGTLFLDELGELPLELQPRLLRVLETGELRRVGGESTVRTDVRVVAATHRDLLARVRAGAFREDLYYRVAQVVISVPALRHRPADVRALAEHFLERASRAVGPRTITAAALERLGGYGWPGNVRELRNVIQAASLAAAGGVVDAQEIDEALGLSGAASLRAPDGAEAVLRHHGGNVSAAARALGVARSTLRNRIRREGAAE